MELWTALVLGLVGSLHCAGMCGPLTLALPGQTATRASFLLGRAAYNLGRVTTYAAIGLLFGLIGRSIALAGFQRWLSIAAGVAILSGVILVRRGAIAAPASQLVEKLKHLLGQFLRRRGLASLYLVGVLNGLLPCGLVYSATAGAAATGTLLGGATYMAVFGLGTVPMMLALALSGHRLNVAFRLRLQPLLPICAAAVGLLLVLRGMNLGIPFVSPVLSAADAAHCH